MERILIVDDNPKNIQLLGNVLTENNYEVEYALNGHDALSILESEDFDLILMDIMMPGMNGFETCKRAKQLNGKAEIPLIFLTAMNEADSISQGFEVGGVDYLTKPFNTNELLARINTHISLKKSKDELNELNQSLEQKVKDRTHELALLNEKLKQAYQDLTVLDQSKSEFLKIINHEIRTPLNGILGFAELIKDSIDDASIISLINLLNESCKRLEHFSIQALDISNFNTMGDKVLDLIDADVNDLLSTVTDLFSAEFMDKNIELNFNVASKKIKVDAEYFSSCIKILLSNAINHTPNDSKILIQGKVKDAMYLIRIQDEGDGFPEKMLQNGIQAFTTKHIDQNPGLDLYLCKLIIENHKGTINLSNNQGAMIEIELPVN